MKNLLLQILLIFCIASCGKLKILDEEKDSVKNSPSNPVIINDRFINGNNTEIPIQSYDDNTITGSGLFHQATILAPQVRDQSFLKMQGFAEQNNIAYVSYSSPTSNYSVIDFMNLSDPQNVKIPYSFVSLDYKLGEMVLYDNHLYVVAEKNSDSSKSILVISTTMNDANVVNSIQFNNETIINLALLHNELTVATNFGLKKYDLTDFQNLTRLE